MLIANRYKLLKNPGAGGGMGEVLYYQDTHLNRKVVVKYLQHGIEERRLLDEQKCLAKLRSKHVVQLYDIVKIERGAEHLPAIVLEYISGNTLDVGSFKVDDNYLNVIWQIACGLTDIHRGGIIHRDIKPANIRIDNEGVVKILDFGLSRNNLDAETRSIIGTPIFMAPELWGDQTIAFDSSIDVYAFGVTCLALVSDEVLYGLNFRPPSQPLLASFSDKFTGFPSEIVRTLYCCLSANPMERPSMDDIRKILAKQLLRNKHRATVILDGVVHTLDSKNRRITLNANIGNLVIEYDGLDFKVREVGGAVYINNTEANVGDIVPGCCVLTFGNVGVRKFVTFDVSNPEVMP